MIRNGWRFLMRSLGPGAVLFGILVLGSCSAPAHEDQGPLAKIEEHGKEAKVYPLTSEPFTFYIKKIPVRNAEDDTMFYIPDRLGQLSSFPCSRCHSEPLDHLKSTDPTVKKAHWDIALTHATEEVLNCKVCHSEKDMDYLRLNNNSTVDFNNSHRSCAQCHASEYKDWIGGAHGKQLGAWVPPRVSATCVDCHNPHSPALETRWPARLNTIKIKELDPK